MQTLTKKKDGSKKKEGLKITFDSDEDDDEGDENNGEEDGEDDDDEDDDIGGFSDKDKTPNPAEKKKPRKTEAITKKTSVTTKKKPVTKEQTPMKNGKRGRRASV